MKKKLIKVCLMAMMALAPTIGASAAVTIGSTADPQATLDVNPSATSTAPIGIIAPRVTLAELNIEMTGNRAHGANQAGAIIFVSYIGEAGTTATTVNVDAIGYYWFDGTVWQPFGGGGAGGGDRFSAPRIVTMANAGLPLTVGNDDQTFFVVVHPGSNATTASVLSDGNHVGQTVTLVNNGGSGNWTVHARVIDKTNSIVGDTSAGDDVKDMIAGVAATTLLFGGGIPADRSRTLIWTGNAWISVTF